MRSSSADLAAADLAVATLAPRRRPRRPRRAAAALAADLAAALAAAAPVVRVMHALACVCACPRARRAVCPRTLAEGPLPAHALACACARPRARMARCPRALAEGPQRPLSIYLLYLFMAETPRPAPERPRHATGRDRGALCPWTSAATSRHVAPPRPATPPDSPHTAPPVHTRHAAPKRSEPFRVLPIDGYTSRDETRGVCMTRTPVSPHLSRHSY